jgi:predicted metal-dependent enzyme (double-stranded beta helix superfamily)
VPRRGIDSRLLDHPLCVERKSKEIAMPKKERNPSNLVKIVTDLAEQRLLWEPLVSYDPGDRYYVRLARQQEFEAWLLTWLPGQGTDWHDHGGSAGAFLTLRGVLTERHTEVGYGAPQIIPGARELIAGTLRAFGSRHVHQVTNQGIEPAVSLHVYAPSLVEMHQYEVRGDLLHVAKSQLVGVNW